MRATVAGALALATVLLGPAAFAAGPRTYRITPGKNQQVRFDASTGLERYAGRTDQVSGQVAFDPEHPSQNQTATITVQTAGFRTGNGSRDSNMRRKHLEVDTFPVATFVLDGIDTPQHDPLPLGKALSGSLHGHLTLHGVTQEIRPTGSVTRETDSSGQDILHITARFVVRLDDYKIPVPRFLFVKVKQEHTILVDLHAIAESK